MRGGVCQDYWEHESSTPWTVCGNIFYSYDDARSLRLKVIVNYKMRRAESNGVTANDELRVCKSRHLT